MSASARRVRGAVVIALAVGLAGCSKKPPPSAPLETVRGKVTYKGEPLPFGYVHFYNGDGHAGIGEIRQDGSGMYEAYVPAGPVQVVVRSDQSVEDLNPGGAGRPAPPGPGGPPGGPPGGAGPGGPPGMSSPPGLTSVAAPGGKMGPSPDLFKLPPGAKMPAEIAGPSEAQRKLLTAVEQQYGSLMAMARRPKTYVVQPGEQTWDIKLD